MPSGIRRWKCEVTTVDRLRKDGGNRRSSRGKIMPCRSTHESLLDASAVAITADETAVVDRSCRRARDARVLDPEGLGGCAGVNAGMRSTSNARPSFDRASRKWKSTRGTCRRPGSPRLSLRPRPGCLFSIADHDAPSVVVVDGRGDRPRVRHGALPPRVRQQRRR